MKNRPFVTIIIPCYQEADFIGRCLDSLVENGYPHDKFEILVMDAFSTDGTREILLKYSRDYTFIKFKNNPKRFPAFAMNSGIKESVGEIIIRCDAHACYGKHYIKKLVSRLSDSSVGNVGGILINQPASQSYKAKAIAYTLGSWFCVGPNRFRTGIRVKALVDTVPFGAWRKAIFSEIGFFNEEFLKAEDLEFNVRIRRAGYKILLDPGITSYYFTRGVFKKLFKMMYQYGCWKTFINKKLRVVSSLRQVFPPLFVLYLIILPFLFMVSNHFAMPLMIYLVMVFYLSGVIVVRKKKIQIFPFCAFTFVISHIGYGLGYLRGLSDILLKGKSFVSNFDSGITR